MTVTGRELTLHEAVPLCQVVTQAILALEGIRSLAIKGPAFAALEVRPATTSNDADILVDPGAFADARAALERVGWLPWIHHLPGEELLVHSVTLAHVSWPCTLDMHHRFPGILADPQAAFGELWSRRRTVMQAHSPLTTTDRPSAMVIEALHRIRGLQPNQSALAVSWLLDEMPAPPTAREVTQLTALSTQLGTNRTLTAMGSALGVVLPDIGSEDAHLAAEWDRYAVWGTSGTGWLSMVNVSEPVQSLRRILRHGLLDHADARRWARSQGLPNEGRFSVLVVRVRRAIGALRRRWVDRSHP